jgi:hypothetical protein
MTPEIVKVEESTIRKALMSKAFINPNGHKRELPMCICRPASRTDLFHGAAGHSHVPVGKAISCVLAMSHDIERLIDAREHLIELIEQAVNEESV